MTVVFSTPDEWRCETTGKVTWYTHIETGVKVSIIELYGSVPATARPGSRPTDAPVYVVRKHLPSSDRIRHVASVKRADVAWREAVKVMRS